MTKRAEYYLDLTSWKMDHSIQIEPHIHVRTVRHEDVELLAELMIDAFVGTIDYEGETIEEARIEASKILEGHLGGPPILDCSPVACKSSTIISACLITTWSERPYPWISLLMTAASAKNQGLGKYLVQTGLGLLKEHGHTAVGAMITPGNLPSEKVFTSLGFNKVG